ncbi:MAG: HAD family hydrolase [Actinomycetota bacterium]|nr:HAD family hydrolase [Actinomycetota bacterium]
MEQTNDRPSTPPGILFDIDGTLVDSNYLHTLAWWRGLKETGRTAPMFQIHRLIGMGSDKLVPELLGDYVEEVSERYSANFRELRKEVIAFDSAAELLREVHGRGAVVVLATSAKTEDLEVLLEVLDAEDAIDHVTSSADVEETKPAPEVLEKALEKSGLARDSAIVVGDTVWDVKAAARLGLGCVCVEAGGTSRHDLEEAGAVAVFKDVQELLQKLDESPLAKFLPDEAGQG